jgi:hypothetical protein
MLYDVKDYREVIKSVKEMQGGYKVAKCMCRSRTEHHIVDRLIELADLIEVLLKTFPPAGTY